MMAVSFQGAHFPKDLLLRGVRWCVAYPLSTRHGEALMQERGVSVDDATINWWVVTKSPQLQEAFPLQATRMAQLAHGRSIYLCQGPRV
jgi:putative transposase